MKVKALIEIEVEVDEHWPLDHGENEINVTKGVAKAFTALIGESNYPMPQISLKHPDTGEQVTVRFETGNCWEQVFQEWWEVGYLSNMAGRMFGLIESADHRAFKNPKTLREMIEDWDKYMAGDYDHKGAKIPSR